MNAPGRGDRCPQPSAVPARAESRRPVQSYISPLSAGPYVREIKLARQSTGHRVAPSEPIARFRLFSCPGDRG
jgi:hypothetical protein